MKNLNAECEKNCKDVWNIKMRHIRYTIRKYNTGKHKRNKPILHRAKNSTKQKRNIKN